MNPRVMQALAGALGVDELDGHEQEEFFDRMGERLWERSAAQEAFFADRNRRGLGVGMDDAGNLVFPAVVMPIAPLTLQ